MSIDELSETLSVDGMGVPRVESPQTVDELRQLLTEADPQALIVGGGTKLSFGNLGGPFDVAISTRRLNRILHYEPADLTIAVEPGVTVSELLETLSEKDQTLPFDAPDPARATIGGMFAAASGGPRRLKYGSLRDWVLGLDVMDGAGVLSRSGGMVVKNVTGYDLARLHHGAHGAFGIVTRLNLKVLPRESSARSIELVYSSAEGAHVAGVAVLGSQLEPTSILISNDNGWTLSIGCEGSEVSIEWQAGAIVDVASTASTPENVVVRADGGAATTAFLTAVRRQEGRAIARLSTPTSLLGEVLQRYGEIAQSRYCADLGSGLLYVSGPASIEWREAIRQASERPVFLSLPPELKQGVDVFGGLDAPNSRIVTNLKSAYDPQQRFNRGRFVLGL